MLFTTPLFKIPIKEENKVGIKIHSYVDDSFLTVRGSTEKKSAAKIQVIFCKLEAWIAQNGIVFDQAKFETIYFSWKMRFSNPKIILLLNGVLGIGERIIKSKEKKGLIRWLGVYFDFRLSFPDHVIKMTSKSRKATTYLSILVKFTREAEADIIWRPIHIYMLLIYTYKTPVW